MIGVYKITNPLNEVYVGKSINVELRIYHHKMQSSNKSLKQSIEKYGWENHKIEILCECGVDELNEKETEYIIKYASEGKILNVYFCSSNGGRKKRENKAYNIRCHPSVIKDVREFAIKESKKYL